jgi:Rod binding domain-containing protein
VKVNPSFNASPAAAQKTNPVKPYEEIAEGMEANFTSYMLQEMKKTVPKETPDSTAQEYYNSLLDGERAQLMAQSDNGLGVKKIILDQIVPQHLKHHLKSSHTATAQGMTAAYKEKINE